MFTKMCAKVRATMGALKRDERGVSALEYAILAVVIVVAVVAAQDPIKNMYKNAFSDTATKVKSQMDTVAPAP